MKNIPRIYQSKTVKYAAIKKSFCKKIVKLNCLSEKKKKITTTRNKPVRFYKQNCILQEISNCKYEYKISTGQCTFNDFLIIFWHFTTGKCLKAAEFKQLYLKKNCSSSDVCALLTIFSITNIRINMSHTIKFITHNKNKCVFS